MKNIGAFFSYLMLVLGCLTAASCQTKIKGETVFEQNQNRLFRQWARDTIVQTKANPDVLSNCLVKSQLVLSADSFLLSDFKTYEFDSKNKISNKEVSNVISLLKEYDELPRDKYELSFVIEKTFSPSVVKGIKYDYELELKDIVVRTSNINIKYKYIRGRLSGKKVFKVDGRIKDKKYDLYDFIWQGDKLIKRKL